MLQGDTFVILPGSQRRSQCVCIIKPKAAEKRIAEIKKNEYQRNIKVTPRSAVLGQNIYSLGAGHSCSAPLCPQLPSAYPALGPHAEQSLSCLGSKGRVSSVEPQHRQHGNVWPKI